MPSHISKFIEIITTLNRATENRYCLYLLKAFFMLKRLLITLIISFSSLHFFAQSECDVLLSKIKKDTEWNILNYFNDIDNALKLNCSENEKIELLLLKSHYLGNVNRANEALDILIITERNVEDFTCIVKKQNPISVKKWGFKYYN